MTIDNVIVKVADKELTHEANVNIEIYLYLCTRLQSELRASFQIC